MKKRWYSIVVIFFICTAMICKAEPLTASAAQWHIYDNGNFFSDNEIRNLEAVFTESEKDAGADIILITVKNIRYGEAEFYLDDYADSLYNNRMTSGDVVLMLYGENERFCWIQGYGNTEEYINSRRIDKMLDKLEPLFIEKRYEEAGIYFAERTAYYVNRNPMRDLFFMNPLFQLLAAIVIGIIAVGSMAASSGGKTTTNQATYLDASHSGITASRDIYLRTTVTKRRRPQQTSGGGGSSRGHSSGGRSRSSGGRRF